MITATLHRPDAAAALTTFSVVVVDGSGHEVYGEPVIARFDIGGRPRIVTGVTGGDGEARFAEDLGDSGVVTLTSHGESLGPIRPRPGARLAIEA